MITKKADCLRASGTGFIWKRHCCAFGLRMSDLLPGVLLKTAGSVRGGVRLKNMSAAFLKRFQPLAEGIVQSEQSIPLTAVLHPLAQQQLLHIGKVLQIRCSDDHFVNFILKSICGATCAGGTGHFRAYRRKVGTGFRSKIRVTNNENVAHSGDTLFYLLYLAVEGPRVRRACDGPLASGRFET